MNIPRHNQSPIDTSVFSQMIRIRESSKYVFDDSRIRLIRTIVSFETGYDPMQRIKDRSGKHVNSRQLFMYFVRKYTTLSQSSVGRLLELDHASVGHAYKCVEAHCATEKDYFQRFSAIDDKLINHLKK